MKLKLENGIELRWATPIFVFSRPNTDAINAELKTMILERVSQDVTLKSSNFEGGDTTEDLLTVPTAAVQTFKGWVIEAFEKATQVTGNGQTYAGKLQISSWVNVNDSTDFNHVHNHLNSAWSGVYYVDVDKQALGAEQSGLINFLDPRSGAGMCFDPFELFGKGRQIRPETGKMLLFPSWLQHEVMFHQSAGDRISISFKIALLNLM